MEEEKPKKTPKQPKPTKDSKKILELREQIVGLEEDNLRAQADLQNVRKRSEENEIIKFNNGKISALTALLPAIDNIERALANIPDDIADHDYFAGIRGILKQFDSVIDSIGVDKIATKDQEFNPETMQAVAVDDNGGDTEIVAEELQTGYQLGDTVIRPAIVKVKK